MAPRACLRRPRMPAVAPLMVAALLAILFPSAAALYCGYNNCAAPKHQDFLPAVRPRAPGRQACASTTHRTNILPMRRPMRRNLLLLLRLWLR